MWCFGNLRNELRTSVFVRLIEIFFSVAIFHCEWFSLRGQVGRLLDPNRTLEIISLVIFSAIVKPVLTVPRARARGRIFTSGSCSLPYKSLYSEFSLRTSYPDT